MATHTQDSENKKLLKSFDYGVHIEGMGESFPRKAKAKFLKERKKKRTCCLQGGVLGKGSIKGVLVVAGMAAGLCSPLNPLMIAPPPLWKILATQLKI